MLIATFSVSVAAAAKKRGIHVIARMSPDLNWEDAVAAHPEWFQMDQQGKVVRHNEDARLFRTCMFSTYMTDYMPAIMREVNSLYDIDGLYTNAWPPLGRLPVCYCGAVPQAAGGGEHRVLGEVQRTHGVPVETVRCDRQRRRSAANFYFANLGGGIRSTANLVQLGQLSEWFQCDNQGRGGEDTPIWGCAMQGRVCNAVQEGKMATNVTGAWSTGPVRWRNVAKSEAEARMWMNETLASGMVPYHHIIGGGPGLGEDRRWLEPARKYFNWTAKYDPHFTNKRSIANIGVVMGQRTQLFYTPPRGALMPQYMDGLYYALLEGRFLFDFVHEEKLDLPGLKKYSALILPNTALLSDQQCRQLRAFVDAGGSLLATFETSLYDERNHPRPDFGLADVFGIRKAGDIKGTTGNAYYARIERPHAILNGFTGTNWIPGAEYRVPVAPVENPVLSVVPGFVAYPPELSYPPEPRTSEPAVVVQQRGTSRLVYFPGDVERTMWRSGHTDLSRLLRNSIRWVAGDDGPVEVQGEGVIESFAWETQAGFAVHVLNYTNPAAHRGWIREFYPIGEQRIRFKLPDGRHVTRIELLRSGADVPFNERTGAVEFTIPRVVDYEVAALHSA